MLQLSIFKQANKLLKGYFNLLKHLHKLSQQEKTLYSFGLYIFHLKYWQHPEFSHKNHPQIRKQISHHILQLKSLNNLIPPGHIPKVNPLFKTASNISEEILGSISVLASELKCLIFDLMFLFIDFNFDKSFSKFII